MKSKGFKVGVWFQSSVLRIKILRENIYYSLHVQYLKFRALNVRLWVLLKSFVLVIWLKVLMRGMHHF